MNESVFFRPTTHLRNDMMPRLPFVIAVGRTYIFPQNPDDFKKKVHFFLSLGSSLLTNTSSSSGH